MKGLIKKLLREVILSEKLIGVDSDVDMLYNKYFKNDIDEIEITGKVTADMFKPGNDNSTNLKDPESIESNKSKVCNIKINYGSNHYDPNKDIISISINNSAVEYVIYKMLLMVLIQFKVGGL